MSLFADVKLLEGTEYEKLLLDDGSPPLLTDGQREEAAHAKPNHPAPQREEAAHAKPNHPASQREALLTN